MSVVTHQGVQPPASGGAFVGRQRKAEPVTDRIRRDGKFFRIGSEKFYVKGVTYGPFAPNREGEPLPERAQVRRDLELIGELGRIRCGSITSRLSGCWICARRWGCGCSWTCRGRRTWSSSTTARWPSKRGRRFGRGTPVRQSSGGVCHQRRQRDPAGPGAAQQAGSDRSVYR